MGQYYNIYVVKPEKGNKVRTPKQKINGNEVILGGKAHEFVGGTKLMEFAWYYYIDEKKSNDPVIYAPDIVINRGMQSFLEYMSKGNPGYGQCVIIMGDYSDYLESGDGWPATGKSFRYKLLDVDDLQSSFANIKYVASLDKKEYVDLSDLWNFGSESLKDAMEYDSWIRHPLAILCADGNGRGGGDYSGNREDDAGRWRGHRIVALSQKDVDEENILDGFEKISAIF
jgi:hypothetical protein